MTSSKVIDVVETSGLTFVVLQLVNGDIAMGMTLSDSTNRWRITGISTIPAEQWRAGRRGVNLQPLGASVAPRIGAELEEVGV